MDNLIKINEEVTNLLTSQGFIKLHRQYMYSEIFCNAELWHMFTWCLMRAAHQEKDVLHDMQRIHLMPGQFITGRETGANVFNIPPSTFRNRLYKLRDLGYISIKGFNKGSIITVVNWSMLQNESSKVDSKRTAERQHVDTNKKVKKVKNRISENSDVVLEFRKMTGGN